MNIHFFNPGHETAVLNKSPYYMAPTNVVAMQRELAFLPAWYADRNDYVFVWDKSDLKYWKYLSDNLDGIAQPITKEELGGLSAQLCLWGISPQAIHFWGEINDSCNSQIEIPKWDNRYFALTSRQIAKDCLMYIQSRIHKIDNELVPSFCFSLDEVESLVNTSSYQLLAKAPYSSSGRGLLWLPIGELTRTERQILSGILKKQGSVSIEKALNKRIDFAMEFMSDGVGSVTFSGYSFFETNTKGAYSGNILDSQQHLKERISAFVDLNLLDSIQKCIELFLSREYGSVYRGCIGIDMMVYLAEDGEFKIHPCVEINMRYNMGYLALQFAEKYLNEGSSGRFYVGFSPKEKEIFNQHLKLIEEYPAEFKNKKLAKGYLPLCPVQTNSHYWSYVLID